MPVSSSWSVPEASSHASPRGCYSCCCFILARSAFQPPSLLTPLLAGTRTFPVVCSKHWACPPRHLSRFPHGPFPLLPLLHQVSELTCAHVPGTRLIPTIDRERMKGSEQTKGTVFLRGRGLAGGVTRTSFPHYYKDAIYGMTLFPNSISKLAGTTLNPCLGANPPQPSAHQQLLLSLCYILLLLPPFRAKQRGS